MINYIYRLLVDFTDQIKKAAQFALEGNNRSMKFIIL